MSKIKFTSEEPSCDRIHYITKEDVLIVLSRLPEETWSTVRVIHFKDQNRPYQRGKAVGYTHHGGSREITLLALPPRVSLTSYLPRGQSPRLFGATRGYQWPRLAVRRFMLYDVLLHEIGHLQVVERTTKGFWEKAKEAKAIEFAIVWRERLWSKQFEHSDSVHNPPTEEEILNSVDEIESYKKIR